jgi:hypothetical protein
MRVTQLKTSMFGFGIVPSSKRRIREFFSVPRYLPAQQLDYYSFPHQPTQNGIQTSMNLPLNNASLISIMFPKHTQDRTCFDNPQYSLQATVNGKNFPDESVSTVGGRFFQQQLVASDLDGPLEITKEYDRSLAEPRTSYVMDEGYDIKKSRRIRVFPWDNTSFMFNIQLERSNAGYCYDGLDSNGQNIQVQLKGKPIATGIDEETEYHPPWDKDTFYHFEPWKGLAALHPCNPEAWVCRETYFRMSENEGVVYVGNGVPPETQIRE